MTSIGKILVIDDNAKLLADALPLYGYEVDVAENGKEGIRLLNVKNSNYDLILLDVMMPVMDGWSTLKHIRKYEKFNSIPIIMLTSVDETQKQISGLKYGADDYIVKPFILPNLLARMEAILRRSGWKVSKEAKDLHENAEKIKEMLTPKEQEILKYLVSGETNAEISRQVGAKETTVKSHLNNIYRKLNVDNRVQATLLAQQLDIL